MNVDGLIKKYFGEYNQIPIIEVFDEKNIFQVNKHIISIFKNIPEIELCVLQGLNYCFYEILDNVLTHSEKNCGTVITRYIPERRIIQVLVGDDGIGIYHSLSKNLDNEIVNEEDALIRCIQDGVTDGKGMGFGLYSTMLLVHHAGVKINIHSGNHILVSNGQQTKIETADFWQGTVVYFELNADQDFDANAVVDFRTDCKEEFDEEYIEDNDLQQLW